MKGALRAAGSTQYLSMMDEDYDSPRFSEAVVVGSGIPWLQGTAVVEVENQIPFIPAGIPVPEWIVLLVIGFLFGVFYMKGKYDGRLATGPEFLPLRLQLSRAAQCRSGDRLAAWRFALDRDRHPHRGPHHSEGGQQAPPSQPPFRNRGSSFRYHIGS